MMGKRLPQFVLAYSILLANSAMAVDSGAQGEPPLLPPPELSQRLEPLEGDSGLLFNADDKPRVVFTDEINFEDAEWIRLRFKTLLLSAGANANDGAVLRVTSLLDGAVQTLNARQSEEWRNTTAYFNGGNIRIEVIQPPNAPPSRIVYDFAWVGEPRVEIESQCGPVDDRILSTDPRSARVLPIGCTVFMINDANGCFLTAGHCADGGELDVVQFNVPLSDPGGGISHPPPEDQYAVDDASIQFTNGGLGNDWCYFGCFANSITGLTPFQAQGDRYTMAEEPPPVQSQPIRITGYGTDNTPLEHNQVQQTHAGPFFAHSGTQLQYQTDTEGGNSGSGVQDDTEQEIIGIHTHGGCQTGGGGANSGTAINHAGLQNALANPRGVCRPGLLFDYPSGRPEIIHPSGGVAFVVEVIGQNGTEPQPGTGMLHFDRGAGFESVPMNDLGGNIYEAVFPATPCGTAVRYYISAETTTGFVVNDPLNAPASFFSAVSAASATTHFADDFQTDLGWTVENQELMDGAWERGVPAGAGDRGDPTEDYDGSGSCYVTDNTAGNSDVDGGPTRLISPIIDLSGETTAALTYARRFYNDDRDADRLDVEASSDGGVNWTSIESAAHTGSWVLVQVNLEDFIPLTSEIRLRFSATDNPNDSVTEAGLDAVALRTFSCGAVELTDVAITFGTLVSGGLPEILDSDNSRLIARSSFGFTAQEPNLIEMRVGARAIDANGPSIDVTVEGRIDHPSGTLRLRLRDWNAGAFVQIAQFAIGQSEQMFQGSGAPAADYIRSSDDRIELSARLSVIATFSVNGFRGFIDQVAIDVN